MPSIHWYTMTIDDPSAFNRPYWFRLSSYLAVAWISHSISFYHFFMKNKKYTTPAIQFEFTPFHRICRLFISFDFLLAIILIFHFYDEPKFNAPKSTSCYIVCMSRAKNENDDETVERQLEIIFNTFLLLFLRKKKSIMNCKIQANLFSVIQHTHI